MDIDIAVIEARHVPMPPSHFSLEQAVEWVRRRNAQAYDDRGSLLAYVREITASKDGAYSERDQLVAALSKLFPAGLERHPDEDASWENDWRWIVFIDLPTGQASWHIHDSELSMFDHLPRFTGRTWDGHSTPEKYARLALLEPIA